MSWVLELQRAFSQLCAGERPQVSFAHRADTVGEMGQEFNALAAELAEGSGSGRTREQAHRQRNRLAGILAVLHVQGEVGALTREEKVALKELLSEAKKLDAHLRQS